MSQSANADKAIIMAGGTGGHIFPGIAVANSLKDKGWEVSWLGSKNGMEEELVAKEGIEIDLITVKGLRGNGLLGWIKLPFSLTKAVLEARKIIKKHNPSVILGFGGFVSGPGGLACKLTGTNLVIHEQNAIAGMTNKFLSKIATHIFQAFPGAFADSNRVTTIGNPIRQTIKDIKVKAIHKEGNEVCKILVIGGSRGALALNKYLPKLFAPLIHSNQIEVKHQAGKGRVDECLDFYQKASIDVESNLSVVEFIDDMADAFKDADLVICRAGASTVSEVAAAGRPAVFIPYPYAVDDHQTANARWLVKEDAAELVQETELADVEFEERLREIVTSKKLRAEMAVKAKEMAKVNAASNVADYCERFRKHAA